MKEDLLQFIWAQSLYNQSNLESDSGEIISVQNNGIQNFISGPDFSDARIYIGENLWVGNVEIHVRASEWDNHRHQEDAAYNSVILHVVYENDKTVFNEKGESIPTLELKGRIHKETLRKYEHLFKSKAELPCSSFINQIPNIQFESWLQRLLIERLERKVNDINLIKNSIGGDWLETFYGLFAGYFGQNQNKLAFQDLARRLPFSILSKHADNRFQVEALLFGVSGLMKNGSSNRYESSLFAEYSFLKVKYGLNEVQQQWKFGGIRPVAFPTRRLALLATIIPRLQTIYGRMMNEKEFKWPSIDFEIESYWNSHYTFNDASDKQIPVSFSASFKSILEINALAPFAFYYGKETGTETSLDLAVKILENAKADSNRIIKWWASYQRVPINAAQSQAMIELKRQYCDHKNCVICNIGKSIILK